MRGCPRQTRLLPAPGNDILQSRKLARPKRFATLHYIRKNNMLEE
jgi:hypothetical protein